MRTAKRIAKEFAVGGHHSIDVEKLTNVIREVQREAVKYAGQQVAYDIENILEDLPTLIENLINEKFEKLISILRK